MIARILSSICISVISMVVLNLLLSLIRLPGRMATDRGGLRRLLRISYELYAGILYKIQPLASHYLGLNILQKIPRTILTTLFSFGIAKAIFMLLGLFLPRWLTILSLLHGSFIGLTWERIVLPEDFQLGERMDE